jgi:hypothetical protein
VGLYVDKYPPSAEQIAENSTWFLFLGGAAVYRCGKGLLLSAGFSR